MADFPQTLLTDLESLSWPGKFLNMADLEKVHLAALELGKPQYLERLYSLPHLCCKPSACEESTME